MKKSLVVTTGVAGLLSLLAGSSMAGPDVIVGDLMDISRWGATGGITAYSVGTISCNIGDQNLLWVAGTNQHPVIGQNMFRLKNGRFEQVGQSWLKHGFLALTDSLCGSCSGQGGSVLGVGCSDPYGSGLNGDQGGLGPKFQVNATNGVFSYPFVGQGQTGSVIYKRLQVQTDDINPSLNAGAMYFVEGQYVTQDDAGAGNALNNASHRRINIPSVSATPSFVGETRRERPAIDAWLDNDSTVVLVPLIYNELNSDRQAGKFVVGAKVTDNGDGTWTYEYAIHNLNSHRSARVVSMPTPCGVSLSQIGFHDVPYHSGEPFDGTDWAASHAGDNISWSTQTFTENANANALRWGTLYNYRFVANSAPNAAGSVQLTLFRPGAVGEADVLTASNIPTPGPRACRANFDGIGGVGSADITAFLGAWFADLTGGTTVADFDCSGGVGSADITAFLNTWFANLAGGC
ncbi:MAG: hypothetical protein H7Y88_13610 [Phycisphaerales bacterium]|nr:hypothetical protein [Phycisphaerales bacterium]